jgi:hypothetical protein
MCAAFCAFAQASLSSDTINLLNSARSEAERGEIARAQAALGCLLMPHGLTIGMEAPGAMSRAVSHAVQVWGERLEDCPFHFTTSRNPELKVRFVDGIEGGGDVQGQVRLQRYVRWGSGGAAYHVRGTILICEQVEGRSLNSREVSAVVEHELGHVLGLDDAPEPGQLMGPFVPGEPVDGPTDDEVAKVSDLRSMVRKDLADMAALNRGGYRR